jgi:Coenzyme PQQ synthesis protein D (PqqD)
MSDTQQLAMLTPDSLDSSELSARFFIPDTVLSQELNGEVVLLSMENETYYSLNSVGSQLWRLLPENNFSLEPAIQTLLQVYGVDEAMLRQDVTALIDELIQEGLLAVSEA